MNTTTTGIVVALAVAVVAVFFIFPGLSPFQILQPETEQSPVAMQATDSSAAATDAATNQQPTATMPTNIPDATQLQIKDDVIGTGAPLAPGAAIEVAYVGALTNGTVFDATSAHGGTPLSLVVAKDGSLQTPEGGELISGWSKGMAGMKEGGKRTLIIPPAEGYGSRAMGNAIPANSTLVFQVELVKVTPAK